jgi:energy-converting hydrogenase B subunit D
MNLVLWALDLSLCGSLLWLAMQTVVTPNLFKAIVMFIAFGLLMALVWARLEAPDIALAEAAIGVGLTGALLLTALAAVAEPQSRDSAAADAPTPSSRSDDTPPSVT